MATSSNRVVIIDEAKFNENNDRNWKKHQLYDDFTNQLDADYKTSLNNRQRINHSFLSALNKSKNNYSLFQVYLKIISQIDQTVKYLQFQFKINNNRNSTNHKRKLDIKCVIDIYYLSGFIQTIITLNKSKYKKNNNNNNNNKQETNEILTNTLRQKIYNHNCLPISVDHNPSKTNSLQTNIKWPTNYNLHRVCILYQ